MARERPRLDRPGRSSGRVAGADGCLRPAAPRPQLALIDVTARRGLEIGPLANPRVGKAEGAVFYLDHATTDELRAKYEQNATLRPQIDDLVDVDFVQHAGRTLADVVGSQLRATLHRRGRHRTPADGYPVDPAPDTLAFPRGSTPDVEI